MQKKCRKTQKMQKNSKKFQSACFVIQACSNSSFFTPKNTKNLDDPYFSHLGKKGVKIDIFLNLNIQKEASKCQKFYIKSKKKLSTEEISLYFFDFLQKKFICCFANAKKCYLYFKNVKICEIWVVIPKFGSKNKVTDHKDFVCITKLS
jgi:hypothetical protein